MQKLKNSFGNILFYAGLVFIVLSIIGGCILYGELSYKIDYLAWVAMVFGILQGLLICGIGVIADHLKEIKNK